jgi:hypothetical protein
MFALITTARMSSPVDLNLRRRAYRISAGREMKAFAGAAIRLMTSWSKTIEKSTG